MQQTKTIRKARTKKVNAAKQLIDSLTQTANVDEIIEAGDENTLKSMYAQNPEMFATIDKILSQESKELQNRINLNNYELGNDMSEKSFESFRYGEEFLKSGLEDTANIFQGGKIKDGKVEPVDVTKHICSQGKLAKLILKKTGGVDENEVAMFKSQRSKITSRKEKTGSRKLLIQSIKRQIKAIKEEDKSSKLEAELKEKKVKIQSIAELGKKLLQKHSSILIEDLEARQEKARQKYTENKENKEIK